MSLPAAITRIIPSVTSFFASLFTGRSSEKAEEIHAQVELTEAQAFEHGRVAPRYVFQYILAAIFFAAAVLLLIDVAWPDVLPGAPATRLADVLEQCVSIFSSFFGE